MDVVADRVEVRVPRRWPGALIVCAASGPSLTKDDLDVVHGKAPVIAINDAVRLAPWADVFYTSDHYWLDRNKGAAGFAGEKYAVAAGPHGSRRRYDAWPDVLVLKNTGVDGLELSPDGLRTGQNSGAAAINLAVHFGASRIALLGYDMSNGPRGEGHFFSPAPSVSPFELFLRAFQTMVEPLRQAGVDVVNCSRRTALTSFRRAPLADVVS